MSGTENPASAIDRRTFLLASSAVLATLNSRREAHAITQDRSDLLAVFKEHGVDGAFALYDVATDTVTTVNAARAARRYVPASTFKIANSLIAIEVGVVKDENEIIPYGGKPQPFKAWERDMPMREAIAASAVPIYQELARRIGLGRYHHWLERLSYGNRTTGGALETFWLDGPLEISAIEQTRFVAELAQQKLSMSARSQAIVRDILRLETAGSRTLYGKTGWRFSSTPQLGWWTGWVEDGGKLSSFAINIDMPSPETDAKKRIGIGRIMLNRLGVL